MHLFLDINACLIGKNLCIFYRESASGGSFFLNYIGRTLLGILSTSVAEELDCLSWIYTMAVYTQLLLHDTQDTNLYNIMMNKSHA